MNRWKAGLTHFALSCVIAGLVYMAVRYFWYPGPLFEVAGGLELLLTIIFVDVTLGPLVTLLVFSIIRWFGTMQALRACGSNPSGRVAFTRHVKSGACRTRSLSPHKARRCASDVASRG